MILIPISCNFFSGSPSANNSEVKRAWPRAMGDRPGSSSRVRTSEDKVRRKDLYWSVRAVYILEKLPDVSGPGLREVGRYRMVSEPTLAVSWARVFVLSLAKALGKTGYLSLNSLITTVIKRVSKWLLLKLFMAASVELL